MLLRTSILLLIPIWICTGHTSFHQGRPRFGMKIEHQFKTEKINNFARGYGASEGNFDQKLDHFSNSTSTWSQHYYWNEQYSNTKQSTVFLMLGGEGPESKSWVENEDYPFIKWAKQFRAFVFSLEHRFYGKSQPTSNLTIENLKYLSSQQAIEDVALFINTMNKHFNFNSPTWIVFGGSYAGALALWARQKHPELIAGAVGSSAPLQAVMDFWQYLQVVESSLQQPKYGECANRVKQGFQSITELMSTTEGREQLSKTFTYVLILYLSLNITLYSSFAAYDNKNFINTPNSYKKYIKSLQNETFSDNNSKFHLLVFVWRFLLFKCLEEIFRLNSVVAFHYSGDERAWTWQQCTEFGYFQSTDANTIFGAVTPNNLFINICRDVFGKNYNADFIAESVHKTLKYYGGADGYTGTNVIIPNGSLDPWHVLGKTKNSTNPSVIVYSIKGGAHCSDMYPVTEKPNPDIIKLHEIITNNLDKWINGPLNQVTAVKINNTWSGPQEFVETPTRIKRSLKPTRKIDNNKEMTREYPTSTQFRKMHFGRPPLGFTPYLGTGESRESTGYENGVFSQPYDHFDNQNPKRFQQRYHKNGQFSKEGGRNFLIIGGEGPANKNWVLDTKLPILKWAQEFEATVYLLEHRYYGNSTVQRDQDKPNSELKYLTSLQMLYDVAEFIKQTNIKLGGNPMWITFGGSYSGALSLWMRELFPDLVRGAVGSSAPLQAKMDFYEYLQVVEASIRRYNNTCAENIGKAFKEMHELVLTPEGRKNLSDTFTLQPEWNNTSKLDDTSVQYFFSKIFGQFQSAVLNNGVNNGAYSTGYGISEMCNLMLNSKKEPLQNVADFNEYMITFYTGTNFTHTENDYNEYVEYLKSPSDTAGQSTRYWMWQTCTEFGYFSSTDLGDGIFGSPTPLNMYTKMCEDVFGKEHTTDNIEKKVAETNRLYGGKNNYTGTNVFIPNGSLDPWHVLGKLNSNDSSVVPFLINGTAHCADIYPARPEDMPGLADAKQRRQQLWCHKQKLEQLMNVVFSDECTFQIDFNSRSYFIQKGSYFDRLRPCAKYPVNIHVWGEILVRSATTLAIFPEKFRLDSEKYCQIIREIYVPFNNLAYNGFSRLVQGNAPSHQSAYTKRMFEENNVAFLSWPAESPDLNPVELVWGSMKNHIKNIVRPINLDELIEGVSCYWNEVMKPDKCSAYINTIHIRITDVIA
uniref:DDE_3 domain-containing protein n=1 Tax=Heterorhabditis bacteriophora TaxID=37862 RepID=A0A1I7XDJ0_HETBA